MPDNRENQSNAPTISSNEPLDNIQEGMCTMKIDKKEEEVEESKDSTQYPDRPGEPDCIYYIRSGKCGYGTNCRFNHPSNITAKTDQNKDEFPQREGQPDCGYYMKTGTCRYGSSCIYHHPLDRRGAGQVLLNTFNLPIRQGEKPCPYYMRTNKCKFRQACKFDHPQPGPLETTLPVPGPFATGTMGSTLTSTGSPYAGTLPTWQLPKSSCVASPFVPSPQAYMPFFSPSQSPLIAEGWNSYMGNLSSVSSSDMMVQNFIYNSNSRGELVTGGLVDRLMQAHNLPQRPDQPECRYFVRTGSCKYGSNCKFHHPRERIPHHIGPHGFPFRPGQDLCNDFSLYGTCQYGLTCRYDHPMYVSGYYYFPGAQNAFFISNSTEASQSKPSKITNWIQKPETVVDKNSRDSVEKTAEVPCKEVHGDHVAVAVAVAAAAPTSSELS